MCICIHSTYIKVSSCAFCDVSLLNIECEINNVYRICLFTTVDFQGNGNHNEKEMKEKTKLREL